MPKLHCMFFIPHKPGIYQNKNVIFLILKSSSTFFKLGHSSLQALILWYRASVLLVGRSIEKWLTRKINKLQKLKSAKGDLINTFLFSEKILVLENIVWFKEERQLPDIKIIGKEDDVISRGQKCKPTTVHLVLYFCAALHCNVALFVISSISRLTLLQSPPSLSLHFYLKDGRDGQNKFIWLWIFLLHIGERRVISLNWELEGVGDSSSALTHTGSLQMCYL